MDLHTKEIISYKLSTSLGLDFVEETIKDTCLSEKIGMKNDLIIHSDQGFPHTSHIYKELLKSKNVLQSMSRKGNCYDNSCIENFFGFSSSKITIFIFIHALRIFIHKAFNRTTYVLARKTSYHFYQIHHIIKLLFNNHLYK